MTKEEIIAIGVIAFILGGIVFSVISALVRHRSELKRQRNNAENKRRVLLSKLDKEVFGRDVDPLWGRDAYAGLKQRVDKIEDVVKELT